MQTTSYLNTTTLVQSTQGTWYITWDHTASWQEPKYLSGSIYDIQLALPWEAVRKDNPKCSQLYPTPTVNVFLDIELVKLQAFLATLEEENITGYTLTEFKKRNISEIPKYETMPF